VVVFGMVSFGCCDSVFNLALRLIDGVQVMKIRKGVTGDEQMANFMNATLQCGGSNKVEFSIATFIELPDGLKDADEVAVEAYLISVFELIEKNFKEAGLTFEAEIGPKLDGTPEDEE